jgi:hypothetical protein
MANVKWNNLSGENDWSIGANWSGGSVPGASDTAIIHNAGTYQVDITSAVSVQEIKLDQFNATLMEAAAGSISAHTLYVRAGTAVLDAANAVTSVLIDGGSHVELGANGALGTHTIRNGGTLTATTDITLTNKITMLDEGLYQAATGHTLKLDNTITIDGDRVGGDPAPIGFGSDDSSFFGTMMLAGTAFGGTDMPFDIDISRGTLTTGSGVHSAGALAMLQAAVAVGFNGGTLDLRHVPSTGDIALHNLYGTGTLLGTSAQTYDFATPNFNGTLSGNFTANVTKTALHLGAGQDNLSILGATGNVTVSTDAAADATLTVGNSSTEHFLDFGEGRLTLLLHIGDARSFNYEMTDEGLRMVVHPSHTGEKVFSLYFDDLTSSSQLQVGVDDHFNYVVTLAPAEIAPHHVTSYDPWSAHDFI